MTTIDTVIDGSIALLQEDAELTTMGLHVYDGDEEEIKDGTMRLSYPAAVVVYAGAPESVSGAMGRGQGEIRRNCEIQVYLLSKEYRGRGSARSGIYALVERTIRVLTGRAFGDDTGRMVFKGDIPLATEDKLVVSFLLRFEISLDTFIS